MKNQHGQDQTTSSLARRERGTIRWSMHLGTHLISARPPPETPAKRRIYSRRRVVESSDEASNAESEEAGIIELSDSPGGIEQRPSKRKSLSSPSGFEMNLFQATSSLPTSDATPVDESTIILYVLYHARFPYS